MSKTFVKVTAEHNKNCKTKPLALIWTDGKRCEIDRVADVFIGQSGRKICWYYFRKIVF